MVPTREVTEALVEGVHHAHADQQVFHVVGLRHLESRQAHIDFPPAHPVWLGPFHEGLVGQHRFQLKEDNWGWWLI